MSRENVQPPAFQHYSVLMTDRRSNISEVLDGSEVKLPNSLTVFWSKKRKRKVALIGMARLGTEDDVIAGYRQYR